MAQTDHNGRFPVKEYKDEGETRRFQRYEKAPVKKVRVPYEDAPPPKKERDATIWLINAFTILILAALASYGLLVWLSR